MPEQQFRKLERNRLEFAAPNVNRGLHAVKQRQVCFSPFGY
jgi:hypothetical protein